MDLALTCYQESLSLRRQIRAKVGDLPQVLNDLRYVLSRLGEAEQAAGNTDAASVAIREHQALPDQSEPQEEQGPKPSTEA